METPEAAHAVQNTHQVPVFTGSLDEFVPKCTVVICTRNRPAQLDQCLESVMRLRYPKFNVLVVDNASSDARTREVATRWGVQYIVEPVVGLSRARNRGARACDAEVVAFLDDDALPQPEWLSGLACEFKDPLVMAVTGRISALRVETDAERLCELISSSNAGVRERRVVDRQTYLWFEMANFGGMGDGGNMAFRRRIFDVWPGFDERLGRGVTLYGGEEHYAFFSLIDRGFRVVHNPHAVVRHPHPKTLQDLRTRHFRDLAASTSYFTFLFIEAPPYRRATLKYVIEGLKGTPRVWREQVAMNRLRILPRWRVLLACLSGPLRYVYSRLAYLRPAQHHESLQDVTVQTRHLPPIQHL